MNWVYSLYQTAIAHPKIRWVVIIATLLYLISPVDVLPEIVLSVFGYLDDGIIVSLLVSELVQLRHKKRSRKAEEVELRRKNEE